MKRRLLFIIMAVFLSAAMYAQTTLISPTGDGGFETGATFTLNGWTEVNGTTNNLYVGSTPVTSAGSNCAFSGSNATTWTGAATASVNHIYRDITFPAGQPYINLSFRYKVVNADVTYDFLKIFLVPTTTTPVAGTQLASGQIGGSYDNATSYTTVNITLAASNAGTTQRLVFSWKNDGTSPLAAVAFDEISLTSAVTPTPLTGIKTIDPAGSGPNNYTSFATAIADLNASGVGTGGVTFNVASGASFYEIPQTITATGTATNPIIFQKSAAAKPVVNFTGTSATDGCFAINAGDYITFDGLDIRDVGVATSSYVDYGFSFIGAATDGCQNNTIKNCVIDLTKANTSSRGVYFSSAATATSGANSFNKFYNNDVKDTYYGYYIYGNSTYLDNGNEIGTISGGVSNISNIGGSSSSVYAVYGVYEFNFKVFNTNIYNVTGTSGAAYGLYLWGTGSTFNIYQNNLYSFSAASAGVTGIYISSGTTLNIYQNKIYDFNYSGTSTSIVYGLYFSGGTTVNAYNNYIYDLRAAGGTATSPAVRAIYVSGPTITNLYNNTVYLNYVSTTASNQSTILYIGTSNVDLRNNIFVNNVTGIAGTKVFTIFKSSTAAFTNLQATSNNNLYFAGTPGANNLIYGDGTNSDQTLAAYKTRVSPKESNSVTELPPFTSAVSPFDLHLKTNVATQAESGGVTVSSPFAITADFDNDPRYPNAGYPNNMASPAAAPDMGADEFGGLLLDILPPAITYSPLMNTSSTSPRTLSATITDISGVPTTGAGVPRLYWKINSGSWNSVPGTYTGSNVFTFTFGAGAVLNDVISYYIVAQDNYTTPNVGSYPVAGASGFSINPPAATTPPTTPSSYTIIGTICGTFNVGSGQTYPTLTAAITDLNNKELTCPVILVLTDATYTGETLPMVLNANPGSSATNTITIKPAPGVTPMVAGSNTLGILLLNGADYVTIDGSNSGGTDKSLTFWNTITGATAIYCVVGMWNDGTGATNNTIKNCIIKGNVNTNTYSYGIFLNYSGGLFNNTKIQNNTILKTYYGMQFTGVATGINTGGLVANNTFGSTVDSLSVGNTGTFFSYCDGLTVSDNIVKNLKAGSNPKGFTVSSSMTNTTITRNSISGIVYTGTGGYGGKGIDINTGVAASNLNITNNQIYGLGGDGWSTLTSDAIVGIRILGTTGGINVQHNTVYLTGDAPRTSTTNSAAFYVVSTATAITAQDNIFYNSINNATTTTSKAYAIYSDAPASTFTIINNNDYFVSGAEGVLGYLTSDKTTLAAWQTATTQDANSLNVDPQFVSATDLHPANIALNNAGAYLVSVPVDFTGALRTNPPDIGAFEFGNDPVVNTTAATAIAYNGATLNGTINAATLNVNSFFDYGTTTAYGTSTAASPASVTGSTTTPVSLIIGGLTGSTTYHYRAKGVAGGLTIYGPDMTFTTPATPPTVVTTAATLVTTTGATLNGTVNANGTSATITFEYGTTTAYGTTVNGSPASVTGSTATPSSAVITGTLVPNTLYHYRIVGANTGGTTNGNDMTFTTAAAPPTVVTTPATNITTTGAQMNGTVNANNASSTVTFEYGLTTAYGTVVNATPNTVNGTTVTNVMAALTGLPVNTTYHYRVCATNIGGTSCGTDQNFLTGCPPVGAAGAVTGPASVCAGSTATYSTTSITNATGYTWSVPTGATITAGTNTTSITVTFGTTSGNVSVYGTGPCGNGTPTNYAVTVNPLPTPTITGPSSACQGSTTNVYTTQPGMTNYTWNVTGGTITAGGTTNSITVTWNTTGAKTVTVNYTNATNCTATAPFVYNVTVNPAPTPAITGTNNLCVNSGYYYYTTDPGYSNYTWNITGGTITWGLGTNQVQVTWNTAGAQSISVNYTNGSGCAAATPTTFNVTVNPPPSTAGVITGTSSVCGGATGVAFSVPAISGASTYVWSLPAGATIASGAGSNNITVNFAPDASSGSITVYGNNLCGNGTVSAPFNVTVTALPGTPGAITGDTQVCAGETGVTYSVAPIANATGYNWILPAGATIVSGPNTATITVDFDVNASSGTISVNGTNSCGNGSAANLGVVVNPIPATPVVTNNDTLLTSSAATGNQWYFSATAGGAGSPITGATAQTYIADMTGWYWTVVTTNGCSSDTSNHVYVIISGVTETLAGNFNLFPVPNDGKFTVSFSGINSDLSVTVVNNLGMKIYEKNISTTNGNQTIDIRPCVPGIYSVIFSDGKKQTIRKIIVK